jgi:hypothetical protein
MSTNSYDSPGKSAYPCNGVYLTHKWDGPINTKVDEELLSRKCKRCGLKYETLYTFRKEQIIKKYRDAQTSQ